MADWNQLFSGGYLYEPDMDVQGLRDLIQTDGVDCTWEVCSRCPCGQKIGVEGVEAITAELLATPQGQCPTCKGVGWYHHSAQTIRTVPLSSNQNKQAEGLGFAQMGFCRFTVLPEVPINFGDKITILDGYPRRFTETQMMAGLVQPLRFPIIPWTDTVGTTNGGTTPTTKTTSVIYCFAADSDGSVVGGANPTVYVEGVNFTVPQSGANAGKVVWSDTAPVPEDGWRVSYTYWCRPAYILTDLPYNHRMTGQYNGGARAVAGLPRYAVGQLIGIGSN